MSQNKLFIAYYRVSTQRQEQSGLGLDAQQKAVSQFLGHKSGKLIRSFTEQESGRRLANRPELIAALDACRVQKAVLIIATLDRLARNVHFVSGLMETKVPFVAADMPHASPFEIHIRAAMAEEERRKISQRTRQALAAAKARGVELGSFGKHVLSQRNKNRACCFARELRPLITQLHVQGFRTQRALVAELNRRKIPSFRGGVWHLYSVQLVLKRLAMNPHCLCIKEEQYDPLR